MSVGTGSIKRAAEKAAETPVQAEGKAAEAVQQQAAEETKAAAAKKPAAKKQNAKKPAAKPASKKAKSEPTEEGKKFMADEVAKSTNEVYQLTQELPVHLL